ncbi:glycine zipper 2TM domain-containing protein [Ramlibacter sp.]|uniref:glycine zipper 2TM domain-containing protein n=1 Tax=Ramlibacter sp. TaxID=1917967 RepID=UPI002CB149E2|nr:glycine zipper 2TM domain-containing protein [Ramlibacter sp.]HWI81940.1 glycine zipper 2TM domain-containing protein [Ramlibacter sp.]
MRIPRLAHVATGSALVASLAACGYNPTLPNAVGAYPATSAPAAAGLEYGRVTNIQYFPGGATASSGVNVPGAIIGAVAGAVIGNQVGRSVGGTSTRDTAAVLGGVGGAVVGSQVGRGAATGTGPVYRVTVQTDQGGTRVYDVPSSGDLRIGDRVRVDNGVIYHI